MTGKQQQRLDISGAGANGTAAGPMMMAACKSVSSPGPALSSSAAAPPPPVAMAAISQPLASAHTATTGGHSGHAIRARSQTSIANLVRTNECAQDLQHQHRQRHHQHQPLTVAASNRSLEGPSHRLLPSTSSLRLNTVDVPQNSAPSGLQHGSGRNQSGRARNVAPLWAPEWPPNQTICTAATGRVNNNSNHLGGYDEQVDAGDKKQFRHAACDDRQAANETRPPSLDHASETGATLNDNNNKNYEGE